MKTYIAAVAVLVLQGCASVGDFNQAQDDTRRGGTIDRNLAEEAARQKRLAAEKAALEAKNTQVTREIGKMDERIATAQSEGRKRDAELQAAVNARRITRQQYDALKSQQSSVQADLAALQMKNANDTRRGTPPDPKVEADKEKRLADLKQRQATLEAEMAKALAVK